MTRSPPKDPLIAIIGATGTGKSQLAVELAKRYNGEIINGDVMQLYAGLPIITNKITVEEQQGVPHHLLGCIGLHEQTWVVGTFVKKALKAIHEIRSRGRLPILVGGTHYYTQSLLFKDRLAGDDSDEDNKCQFVEDAEEIWPMLKKPTEVLLEELRKVDPKMAGRWHPNDRRKIQRSLEIYLQTGKRASDIYAGQRERKIANGSLNRRVRDSVFLDGPTLRFPTLMFWVHVYADALRQRLDKRVDKMLDQGLMNEVETMNAFADAEQVQGVPVDETRGIWVSIGYKEFKNYAHALNQGTMSQQQLEKLKAEALEKTKIATRQYSKRQLRWIRIKLINALAEANAGDKLYLLDGSNITHFDEDVVTPAVPLTHQFLTAIPMSEPASLSPIAAEMLTPRRDYDLATAPDKWTRQLCEVCGVTCVTEDQWQMHVKSKGHRKLASRQKKAEEVGNGTHE